MQNRPESHLDFFWCLKMTKRMEECADHPSLWSVQRFYMVSPIPDWNAQMSGGLVNNLSARTHLVILRESKWFPKMPTLTSLTTNTPVLFQILRYEEIFPKNCFLELSVVSLRVLSSPFDSPVTPLPDSEMSWLEMAFKNRCSGLSYSQ